MNLTKQYFEGIYHFFEDNNLNFLQNFPVIAIKFFQFRDQYKNLFDKKEVLLTLDNIIEDINIKLDYKSFLFKKVNPNYQSES